MKRTFNHSERLVIWQRAGGLCQECGKSLKLRDKWHADHIIPYSKGGKTIVLNGQLLCPSCNLKKGNQEMSQLSVWNRPLRTWQSNALALVIGSFNRPHNGKAFVLSAFPGSGKTTFALRVAYEWLSRPGNPFVVVIVPSKNLVGQFKVDATKVGINLSAIKRIEDGYRAGFHGIVVTYALMDSQRAEFQSIYAKHNGNVLIIADECHHIAGQTMNDKPNAIPRAWGEAFKHVAEGAHSILMMTGTPWRSDDHLIPFVHYEADHEGTMYLKPDFSYTYEKALIDTKVATTPQDKIARELMFVMMGGEAEFTRNEEDHRVELSPELKAELVSATLKTAYQPGIGTWFRNWFIQADEALLSIRNNPHAPYPHASGLVIAGSKDHADAYADLIEEMIHERPCVVHFEVDNADKVIDNYRDEPERSPRWIVSVNMISEGVDIPRLSVLLYTTFVRQQLYFFQAIGRVIRWDRGQGAPQSQMGRVYIPFITPLDKFADEIKGIVQHVVELREQGKLEPSSSDNPPRVNLFVPLDSIDAPGDVTITINDKHIPAEFVKLADQFAETYSAAGVTREFGALLLHDMYTAGKIPKPNMPQESHADYPSQPLEEQLEIKSKALNDMLGSVRIRFFPEIHDKSIAMAVLNKYLNLLVTDDPTKPKKRGSWGEQDFVRAFAEVRKWFADNEIPPRIFAQYTYLLNNNRDKGEQQAHE